jgi:hypothetical protein
MNLRIPARLQVFDEAVVISSKDRERLSAPLSGWRKLAPAHTSFNESDLERLIVLELMGKKRRKILGRLLQRLGSEHTARIDEKVWSLLPAGKPREDFR